MLSFCEQSPHPIDFPGESYIVYKVVKLALANGRGGSIVRMMLARLFAGRNGIDQLNTAVLWAGIACWVLHLILPGRGLGTLLYYAFVLAVGVYIFRALSRNLLKRGEENRRFLEKTAGLRKKHDSWQGKAEQRKQYKIFKCPSCSQKLRVPRGKGTVQITCRQCGAIFEKKT